MNKEVAGVRENGNIDMQIREVASSTEKRRLGIASVLAYMNHLISPTSYDTSTFTSSSQF